MPWPRSRFGPVPVAVAWAAAAALVPPAVPAADAPAPARAPGAAPGSVALDRPSPEMLEIEIERRRLAAIARENAAWGAVTSRGDWERFRDARIRALRASLGSFPDPGGPVTSRRTGEVEGDGFVVENVVFESRPGLWVTANLYAPPRGSGPAPGAGGRPAFVLSHSHHNPKEQGELQDMGMTWARAGGVVLVPDHLGHGERRQHPFARDEDYPGPFRRGRQDYYFRYDTGLQLALAGESLLGWMAADLVRGVDLLLSRPDLEVDPGRIIVVGAVAGGGDPAGVAAALDPRIDGAVPFNFGGPQPDYAIPEDAEGSFYYFGVAYWEQTRCLRLGGRDGFAHWIIVGSLAPRHLVYGHEFGWERGRDPVWPRLERVYGFYGARQNLSAATGRGTLRGRPPESTHCNNVGPVHRRGVYPHLERWFGMPAPEPYSRRLPPGALRCLTPELSRQLGVKPLRELAARLAGERLGASRRRLAALDIAGRRALLREGWARLLGGAEPPVAGRVSGSGEGKGDGPVVTESLVLETDEGIAVPLVLLRPAAAAAGGRPSSVVVALAAAGQDRLRERCAPQFGALLGRGIAVALPDLRAWGRSSPGSSVGRGSPLTTLSCRAQVLGQTLPGGRLRDLRAVLRYLRSRPDLGEIALWGTSLAPANPPGRSPVVPHGAENSNLNGAPEAGHLVLLAALFEAGDEEGVVAVAADGTLARFRSVFESPFLYLPHAALVPGALAVGDVADLAAALAPLPLRLDGLIDGLNRAVPDAAARAALRPALDGYRDAGAAENLTVGGPDPEALDWLAEQLSE